MQAIADFAVPRTKRELRRFLGMTVYYQGFCKNFSDVVLPLTNMLRVSQNLMNVKLHSILLNHSCVALQSWLLQDMSVFLNWMFVDASMTGAAAVLL